MVVEIRLANPMDFEEIWPIFNEIVSEDSELLTASGSDVGTAGR